MFAHSVCVLLGFRACEFPAKSKKIWTFIFDRRLYKGGCDTYHPNALIHMKAFLERVKKIVDVDLKFPAYHENI